MIDFDRLEPFPDRGASFLKALFRGAAPSWPDLDSRDEAQFIAASRSHGVQPLIHRLALEQETWPSWQAHVWNDFAASASAQAALELLRRRDLVQVLGALAADGVTPLIFKGTALAYTHYESAELRPRSDTDLFIDRRDLDRIRGCFERLGYRTRYRQGRELVFAQASFARREYGVLHSYDCHWRLTNRLLVQRVITYDECRRDAIAIPALGKYACAFANVHALLAACVHRVAHHGGSNRLIWLADIHRLATRMSPAELESFWRLATEREVAQICADGFRAAEEWFGAMPQPPLPENVREGSSVLLRPRLNRLQLLWYDLLSIPSWRERFALLSQVTPSPDVLLRPRRLVRGIRGWLDR